MNIRELQERLDREGLLFWKSHDYQKALTTLNKLRQFWGDFSLYDNRTLLKGSIQLVSYLGRNNLDIVNINPAITYEFLLNDFADYWNQQAQNFIDNQKRLDALIEVDVFKKLISAVGDVLNVVSSPVFLVALFGTFFVYLIKKK